MHFISKFQFFWLDFSANRESGVRCTVYQINVFETHPTLHVKNLTYSCKSQSVTVIGMKKTYLGVYVG